MVPKHADSGWDSEGHWEWNAESNRIHFSARWAALVGDDERELGTSPESWLTKVHPDDFDRVSVALKSLLNQGGPDRFDLPHRIRHRDGSYRWMSCRGSVQRNAAGTATRVVGAHADVTADTVMDSVTGLPNGLLLLEHLGRSIERANRYNGFHFALLVVDLDRRKSRDTPAASAAGDPLLVAAARRLETCFRIGDANSSFRHDDLVARLQGDQFAILVDGLKEVGDATVVAGRVLAVLVTPFPSRDREVFLSPSVGVAVSATGYATPSGVLRDAETALHRAKLLGKARYEVFDTAILKSARAELQLEADFAGAIDRGEFQVFYQPVVAVEAHAIVGFEALARWQHPVLGMVSPLDFIPVAEKTGFILALGMWILREACRQLKAWQQLADVSPDLWVSVNVSGVQFQNASLVGDVSQILADLALDPRHLVLELTEGIASERPEAVKTLLMQLRSLGIRISVDDFGTGHSSLSRLRQFPIDCLKVDRSFVRGLEGSADVAGILATVSSMARQLGLRVVVEGVENEAQLALVRPLDCHVQGYVFSKPLDSGRATALLATGLPAAAAGEAPPPPAAAPAPEMTMANATATATRAAGPAVAAGTNRRWAMPAYAAAVLLLLGAVALVVQLRGSPDHPQPASVAPDTLSPGVPAGDAASTAPPAASDTSASAPETQPPARNAKARTPPTTPDGRAGITAKPSAPSAVPVVKAAGKVVAPRADAAPPLAATPGTARAPAPPPASVEVEAVFSTRVVHRHRLGNCRGVLSVSRQGIEYAPEGNDPKDAFRFAYGQFVHGVDGDGLTIKTSDRTFRFEPLTINGVRDVKELAALGASLNARH
jgi:diguanylate cyclase (GGDEF)-like protein/PAS domain S-box-containing protein